MSQPSDRGALVPAPGKVDASLGEFWVENPWDIVKQGHNLSAYERNRAYLNVPGADGRNFLDISYLSGGDSDGDGRSVVAGDFRNIGRLDLMVRQVGGGPFLLLENDFPQKHYLKVGLRGTKSNRMGIGARLVATAGGHQLVREQFPVNTYHSQASNIVHFGLGDSERVECLTIRWPSGQIQELRNLAADRHILVQEGNSAVDLVTPGKQMEP